MLSKAIRKCIIVFSMCLLMCPKRVRVREMKTLFEPQDNEIAKLSQDESEKNLGAKEPGFDLTEDEITKFKIWPQGIVPYYIDELSFDKVLRDRLRSFLETVGSSGLHFFELPKPPEDQSRWVFFINRRGALECPEYTTNDFTNNGVQKVILGYDCLNKERALASTVLALAGVPPQHNAPDRDQYIDVNMENILPDKQNLYKALENNEWLFHDLNYDYNSAGHFDWLKYSANGKATITPKKKTNEFDSEINSFSSTDLQKIRMLYNFISQNTKVDKARIAKCNQIFNPGVNFVNYEPDSKEDLKARSKPNKYMGIYDDQKKFAKAVNVSRNTHNSSKPDQDDSKNDDENIKQDSSAEVDEDNISKHEKHGNNKDKSKENDEGSKNQLEHNDAKDSQKDVKDSVVASDEIVGTKNEKIAVEDRKSKSEKDVEGDDDHKRLAGINKKSLKFQLNKQSDIFDESDFDTSEKVAKLKHSANGK